MAYLLYFFQSYLMFVTPLRLLRYKSTAVQKILFTIIFGVGEIFSRHIYKFLKIPFGTHTLLLFFFCIILFKIILKGFSWQKSIYMSLIAFIILLINDFFIVVPVMKLLDLTVGNIDTNNISSILLLWILPNILLFLVYIVLIIKDLICSKKGLKGTIFRPIGSK